MFETDKAEVLEWLRLYGAPGLAENRHENTPSLGLPAAVASEFARLASAEASFAVLHDGSGIDGYDGGRAEYLGAVLDCFAPRFKNVSELAFACGGVMLKPVLTASGKIATEVFTPADFEILGSEGGSVTEAEFVSRCKCGQTWLVRRERHEKAGSGYRITNRFYRASSPFDAGREFSAREAAPYVPEWAGLASEVYIKGLDKPLFSYYRVGARERSPYGVSVYARAVGLMREADAQFGRLLWEFEGGELAIDASEDAFRLDRSGKPVLPVGRERLFRPNKLDYTYGSVSDPLRTFSPALRDVSLINGLNQIISRVEDAVGLARGTFSDPQQAARTATEIKMMRQRTYAAVRELQTAARSALEGLVSAADALCTLYELTPAGRIRLICDFGDSVLSDSGSDRALDQSEVAAGLMTRDEYRAKWHEASART